MKNVLMEEHSDRPLWSWKHTKRRILPNDPFFEEGDIRCSLVCKQIPIEDVDVYSSSVSQFPCHVSECMQVFESLASYEMHYSTTHRHVCGECKRSFPSNHLLDIHLLEWHDSMFELLAEKQPMYQCLVEGCTLKYKHQKARKDHLIKEHHYPSSFRFGKPKKNISKANTQQDLSAMETEATSNAPIDRLSTEDVAPSNGVKPLIAPARQFSYKVPKNICFGQGATRGFSHRPQGKKRGKRKNWHQMEPQVSTTVNIEDVSMGDLAEAIE